MGREEEKKNIILVGELADVLGIKFWDVHRLEKRGIIPHSKRKKRGKYGWRYWLRSDLEKIKEKFHNYSEADSFLEGRKFDMDIRSNKQIVKFLKDVVISHTIIHREEKISEVLISFHFDKGEKPKAFEVIDIYHQGE